MEARSKHFRKRDAVLAYLRSTDCHPTAEMVHAELKQQIPDLSLGTVYRNLALFKQQGLVQSLGTVNGVERYDGNVEPHVHFVCTCCDRVLDLHGLEIPEQLCNCAGKETGGTVEQCMLTFFGRCAQCVSQ